MNKKMIIPVALLAAGFVSSASGACGDNLAVAPAAQRVYLTGSTAYRSVVFNALRSGKQAASTCNGATLGTVFDSAGFSTDGNPAHNAPDDPRAARIGGGAAGNGDNGITYEGYISGVLYDVVCIFSGSEAGLASVANTTVQNVRLPANQNGDGTPPSLTSFYNLPNAPATFPDPAATPPYTVFASTTTQGDLALADTSSAVSLTKTYAFSGFGTAGASTPLGIVPFTWVKNKNSAPNASWTHLTGVGHSQLLSFMAGTKPAAYFTGTATDTETCYLVGRNKGSGTRVNTVADTLLYPSTPVQYYVEAYYPTTDPTAANNGVLTFVGDGTTSPGQITQGGGPVAFTVAPTKAPSGDGFESGGFVAQEMECDGANNVGILIGYLGIGDANTAKNGKAGNAANGHPANPGGAVWLTLDGVAESNGAVEEGQYSFWGHEHLYGQTSPNAQTQVIGPLLQTGITAAVGTLGSVAGSSDTAINLSFMHCDKAAGGDLGWPTR